MDCLPGRGRGGVYGFHFAFWHLLCKLTHWRSGPSGSCKKKSSKRVNVLKRKLRASLFLPHQRPLSPTAPVCRRFLSLAFTPGVKRSPRFAPEGARPGLSLCICCQRRAHLQHKEGGGGKDCLLFAAIVLLKPHSGLE